jgi:two-component system response regulator HupR/HoxA
VDDEIRSPILRRILEDDFEVLTASSTHEAEGHAGRPLGAGDPVRPAHARTQRRGVSHAGEGALADVIRMIMSGYTDAPTSSPDQRSGHLPVHLKPGIPIICC